MDLDRKDTTRDVTVHRELYRGHIFGLVGEEVDLGNGSGPVFREYLDHPGAVAIVALRAGEHGEEVLLLDQYRHPVRAVLWEVPAGLLDVSGEDYLAAAQRELAEEADLRAEQWHVLIDYFTTPGGSNESLRVYLARGLSDVPEEQRFHRVAEERDMTRHWMLLDEALAAIHAGEIHNPSAVVGILAAVSARGQDWRVLRPPDAAWMR